ncbi:MAG: RHS repeat-associated core domain-containing protein, partial [Bacillota bacterium]|nr:RHS repeat-associated core domain-containing protein [Bacillota bacterium]
IATKPFGEPHATSALTSYLFTGKDLDSTGLYYFAARYYDASVGRFISPDPHWNHHNMIYGDDPDNKFPLISAITQSTNLYVYCMNNPLGNVDPDGELAYPGQIHNAVADHIKVNYGLKGPMMVRYRVGFGFADLIHPTTGEVWEVKRNTLSVPKALAQLSKYTANSLQRADYRDLELKMGGSAGTVIASDSFVMTTSISTYKVQYWDMGNGIIQYDYQRVTDWKPVVEVATAAVFVGCVATALVMTHGLAVPLLIPLLVR